MNDSKTESPAPDPAPEPDSTSPARPPAQEGWLERLKAAVGLRAAVPIRQEIAEALDTEDAVAGFSPEERAMLANILRLREVRVDDVMVPRADIDAVEVGTSLADLLAEFQRSGHSRMPVYRETLDDPIGFVHIKDIMDFVARTAAVVPDAKPNGAGNGANGSGNGVGRPATAFDLPRVDLQTPLAEVDLVRTLLFVPPSMPVMALLASMQATRMQMALVIDEYGGTDGLVSLEDVVEMVVGDIEDEHDGEARQMIIPDGEGVFLADARADLDEVSAAIGSGLAPGEETEDVDTIGGLVFSLLGRIPVRGELVSAPGGFEFEVLDADPRRIRRLRIYRRTQGSPRPEPRRRPRPTRPEPDAETGVTDAP
ncbi:hemolysin family protein [Bauldia sp.]|uniref:hemolysin family protein n=1 Tax=Bauldia sp. TaxID=2575872 RepID=UPI003BAD4512